MENLGQYFGLASCQQVEHADNILFYIDDNQVIFTDSTQGDNEVDLLSCTAAPNLETMCIAITAKDMSMY